jgi:hypothetical protein
MFDVNYVTLDERIVVQNAAAAGKRMSINRKVCPTGKIRFKKINISNLGTYKPCL